MTVIKKLSERVEREHDQFLRDSQRIEDRSGTSSTGANTQSYAGTVDFESLVGRADSISKIPGGNPAPATGAPSWEDDVWGSIFNETARILSTPIFYLTHFRLGCIVSIANPSSYDHSSCNLAYVITEYATYLLPS